MFVFVARARAGPEVVSGAGEPPRLTEPGPLVDSGRLTCTHRRHKRLPRPSSAAARLRLWLRSRQVHLTLRPKHVTMESRYPSTAARS